MIRRAFRYRLYPNREQQHALAVQFGHARFAYNWALATRKDHYEQYGKGLSFYDLKRQLTALKHTTDFSWLCEADSQVLQAKIEDLDRAYTNFFEKRAKYPNFKSRKHAQSIRYPQRFKFSEQHTYLPKIGWVKTVFHRPLQGTVKNITVTKSKSGKYFVSVQCEVESVSRPQGEGVIGVDLGLKHFAVLSTGQKIDHPHYLRKSERRLKRLQRRLSRKVKGSTNRDKARLRLVCQAEHVASQRKDFLDQLSAELAATYHTVRLENLNVCGMLKNHSLAKSISDSGWGMFGRMLEYKAACVERIDRFYPSSKTCSVCGRINQDLQLKDRFWTCPVCKTEHDRDINAALNIERAPTAGTAGRHTPVEIASDGVGFRPTRSGRGNRKPKAFTLG